MKKMYVAILGIICLLALTSGCGSGSGGSGSQDSAESTVYAAPVKDASILVHREALTTEKQAELGTATTFEVGHSDDHGNITFDQTALSYVASYPVVVFAEQGVLYASQYTTLAEAEAAGASEDTDIFHGYLADVLDSPTGEVHLSPAAAIVARLFTLSTNHDLDDLRAAQDSVTKTIMTEMGLTTITTPLGDPTENMSGYEAIYQSFLYAMGLTEHSDCTDCVAAINECAEALRNDQSLWSVVQSKHTEFATEKNLQAALTHNNDAIKSGAQEALGGEFEEEQFQQEMPAPVPEVLLMVPEQAEVAQSTYTIYRNFESTANSASAEFSCAVTLPDGTIGSFKVLSTTPDSFYTADALPVQNGTVYDGETTFIYKKEITDETRNIASIAEFTIVPISSLGAEYPYSEQTITAHYTVYIENVEHIPGNGLLLFKNGGNIPDLIKKNTDPTTAGKTNGITRGVKLYFPLGTAQEVLSSIKAALSFAASEFEFTDATGIPNATIENDKLILTNHEVSSTASQKYITISIPDAVETTQVVNTVFLFAPSTRKVDVELATATNTTIPSLATLSPQIGLACCSENTERRPAQLEVSQIMTQEIDPYNTAVKFSNALPTLSFKTHELIGTSHYPIVDDYTIQSGTWGFYTGAQLFTANIAPESISPVNSLAFSEEQCTIALDTENEPHFTAAFQDITALGTFAENAYAGYSGAPIGLFPSTKEYAEIYGQIGFKVIEETGSITYQYPVYLFKIKNPDF